MQPLVALYLCHAALSDLIFVLIQMENDCAKNKTAYTVEFSITKYWFRNVMQIWVSGKVQFMSSFPRIGIFRYPAGYM